jgi:SAM-dependent methyltransferase
MSKSKQAFNTDEWNAHSQVLLRSRLSGLHRSMMLNRAGVQRLIGKHDALLDLGCGSGPFLRHFQGEGYDNLYGVEPDPDLRSLIPASIATVKGGVAEAIPFEDGRFDVVFVYGVLHHLKADEVNYRQACREIARVVKPGGHVFIIEPGRYRLFLAFEAAAHLLGIVSRTFRSLYATMVAERVEQHFFLKHHGVIRQTFEALGFKRVTDGYFVYSWIYTIRKPA